MANVEDQFPRAQEPLIILIHGTWATKSSWTMPDRSTLVAAITREIPGVVAFHRYCWSGRNRVRDRIEAANRLTRLIQRELEAPGRLVFLLAHSHGGNVAMRALEGLSDDHRRSVRPILMATPFLNTVRRFDVREIFRLLPADIQSSFPSFCLLGFLITYFLLVSLLQEKFVPRDYQIPLMGGTFHFWQFPILVLIWVAPFVLFKRLWRILVDLLASGVEDDRKHRAGQQMTLVLAYSQDEAFQALSIVVNLMSLVHQTFFMCVLGFTWALSKAKPIDWLLIGLGLVVRFAILAMLAIRVGAGTLLGIVNAIWPSLGVRESILFAALREFDHYVWVAFEFSVSLLIASMFIVAILIETVFISLMVVGAIRVAIFVAMGVLDQVRNRSEFFNAAVGGVAISMIPDGGARSELIEGRALFNHVKIYDDPQAVGLIAQSIREQMAGRPLALTP
ncbi:alpha/beta hydrolase [Bradyrhizobium japonicum]|uniref:alpha/beta fold hydrolase n=1 Tax=Bradyrhizobium japonicum TaxID=375 RepID=UPI001BA958CA|nr:alpha/beta fold hydrolase [Bradyrhizobium japonicum]MBR0749556.1 alpha/beta hydrolase [Bradyrhizobium japonicum]